MSIPPDTPAERAKLAFQIGDQVRVKLTRKDGTNRTPFHVRGKRGVVVYSHGPQGDPADLSRGGTGEPGIPMYGVCFDWPPLQGEESGSSKDEMVVDIWEDWLDLADLSASSARHIDRKEHGLTHHEKLAVALQAILVSKGILNIDEVRRLVAESDFERRGVPHPMVES